MSYLKKHSPQHFNGCLFKYTIICARLYADYGGRSILGNSPNDGTVKGSLHCLLSGAEYSPQHIKINVTHSCCFVRNTPVMLIKQNDAIVSLQMISSCTVGASLQQRHPLRPLYFRPLVS